MQAGLSVKAPGIAAAAGETDPAAVAARPACRLGLVALGDSITVGEGAMVLGVTALSWAQWLAQVLDLPFTSYAFNGAVVRDLLDRQLPRVHAHYDLACVYAGVNDVRSPDWDSRAFERDYDALLAGVAPHADRLLVLTLPLDLGRPTCAPKPVAANAIVRRLAARHGATIADLSNLRGWMHLLPDAVHPTALGQLEIADRAARALGSAVLASDVAGVDRSLPDRARYAPAYGRAVVRDLWRRARECM